MNVIRDSLRLTRQVLALVTVVRVFRGTARAQVGLASGLAQVTLVVNVAPKGTIDSVAVTNGVVVGSVQELSAQVSVSANAPYHLMVRPSTGTEPMKRIWARDGSGEFQLLQQGAGIIVADGGCGSANREIRYRIEVGDTLPTRLPALSVRYELMIDPSP